MRQLEAHRPITFGGLGDGADGPAYRVAHRAASTELEKSLLRGLLAGAMWTAARVSGHGTRANSACPRYGAAHEDEAHVLWECPERDDARGTWLLWLNDAAGAISNMGPPDRWPSCLQKAGLFPSGWDRGWTGTSSTNPCTTYMACTWRSSLPAGACPAAGGPGRPGAPAPLTLNSRGPVPPKRPPQPPASLLLRPNGGRALSAAAIPVHTAATEAARQGQHGRGLVPSGTSVLAAVQAQAGGP